MSKGVNKAILVGNIGQDPETRTFPNGGQVTNISVATSESWTDKQTGQKQERTTWHRVVFNGRLAEIAAQYLRKGSKVYIEGSLRTRKWQDKQTGQDRYSTDIYAREMQMLDSSQSNGDQQASNQQSQQNFQQQAPQQQAPAQQGYQQQEPTFNDFEDDIPF